MRRTPPLTWVPGTVTVLMGDRSRILHTVAKWDRMMHSPMERGKPLWSPGPLVTQPPVLAAGQELDEPHLDAVRRHHEVVIVPGLNQGRSIVCLGAWWRPRGDAAAELTQGLDLPSMFAFAWPRATGFRCITYLPNGLDVHHPGSASLSPVANGLLIGPGSCASTHTATSSALSRLGVLTFSWQVANVSRTR